VSEDKCRCGHLVEHFGNHMMNCPLHPLRAEAIAEEQELAALRAENTRLREARGAGEDALRSDLATAQAERDALREQLRLRPTEDALRASNAILHEWRAHAGKAKNDRDRWKARAENAERSLAFFKPLADEYLNRAHGAEAWAEEEEKRADRLAGLIREYVAASDAVVSHEDAVHGVRFNAADAALRAEVKP